MAGLWTAERFPQFEQAIRRLTEQHRELEAEPLHLAVTYLSTRRDPRHIYLFEVVGAFGGSINPEQDLFEVTFATTAGFPLTQDEELHLILTNPHELEFALERNWPLADEVVSSIRSGNYQVLFQDQAGEQTLTKLQTAASRQEAVRG